MSTDSELDGALAVSGRSVDSKNVNRVMLHMPVDVRSVSLALIAVLACLVVLKWAAAVFVPIFLGLMISYALAPLVDRMCRWHIPRALSAAILLLGISGGLVSTIYWRSDDAAAVVDALPSAVEKLSQVFGASGGPGHAIDKVQQAAQQLVQATDQASSPTATGKRITQVQVERPRFDVKEFLWSGTLGLVSLIGQATVVCFIAYFLLASGDVFRRKLVKIAGKTLTEKKITVQALDEITEQIQLYLLVQLFTSALVGLSTWLAFWWLGLDRLAVWGIAAGVLNLIPYLGSIVITGGSSLLGLMQFGTVDMALAIGASSLGIHVVTGYLLTPWLTGKVGRMSPVVVFVGVLAWGWLWGVWGLLLGIPILMIVKAVCDRVEDLKPVGELLGR